jgi:uncharacterized membrane-anchored protein YitT (DUF2179 family)
MTKPLPIRIRRAFEHPVFDYFLILLGAMVLAMSFNSLLLPNHIASGGVVGVSILIQHIFGFEPAYTQWLINIPLFLIGVIFLGRKYGLRTALGTLLLPLFIYLTKDIESMTSDSLLAAVFGGLGAGLGVGITYRGKGSMGGFSILSNLLSLQTGLPLGRCTLLLDGTVIFFAGFIFGPEQALYALIAVFLTSQTIDVVQIGFHSSKVAFVISKHHEEINGAVQDELQRGATQLTGIGGFSGQSQNVLLLVVSQSEVNQLKAILHRIDPSAFIILWDSYEVLGKGFRPQVLPLQKKTLRKSKG